VFRLLPFVSPVMLATGILLAGTGAISDASTPALSVSVGCYSNPERTIIHNNRSYAVTIKSIGSIYRPYRSEPYYVYRRLAAGRTVTYYTGYGASASSTYTLTRRYIYNNTVGSLEGARVRTTSGLVFVRRCA
jgi:hypothetical protein